MHTKQDLAALSENLVYVKAIDVKELSEELQAQAGDTQQVYALHDASGQRLALVANRRLAIDLARQNDMTPVALQ